MKGYELMQLAGLLGSMAPNTRSLAPLLMQQGFRGQQQAEADAQQQANLAKIQNILGKTARVETLPQQGPMLPGQQSPDITATTQGSGFLGSQRTPKDYQNLYTGLLSVPGFQNLAMKGLLGGDQSQKSQRSEYFVPHDISVPDGKGGFTTKSVMINARTGDVAPLNYPGSQGSVSPKDVGVQSQVRKETTKAGVIGTAQGTAITTLPDAIYNANRTLGIADKLAQDSGLDYLTGGKSYIPGELKKPWIANAQSYLDQLKGMQFMSAYKGLKGGGQITEVEGQKATDAIARMQSIINNHGSKADFLSALDEYKKAVYNMTQLAQKQARGDYTPLSPLQTPTQPTAQPTDINALVNKYANP